MKFFHRAVRYLQSSFLLQHKAVMSSGARPAKSLQMTVLASLVGLMMLMGFYYYENYAVVLPKGVIFQGHDVAGLNRVAFHALLEELSKVWNDEKLVVKISENGDRPESRTYTMGELGISYDVSATVATFFDDYSSLSSADVLVSNSAPAGSPVFRWPTSLPKVFDDLVQEREREPQNASITFDTDGQRWVLNADQYGLRFLDADREQLQEHLLREVQSFDGKTEKSVAVVFERVMPEVTTAHLQVVYDELQAMLDRKVMWEIDHQPFSFSLREHQSMVVFDPSSQRMTLDEKVLREYVTELASRIDKTPTAVKIAAPALQERGYYLAAYEGDFVHGRSLDQEAFFQSLLSALQKKDALEVPLDVTLSETVTDVEMEGIGKLTLLSQGRSSYRLAHSEDRTYNVKFGLSKYDGVVIPQGAEFSFNQVLGWVTEEAGWKKALAIFGGGGVRPVPGGGLCQVSTTMYRAAILSGLPIKWRKPHSLDVSYYQEYGYGIDATVYPPEDIDLKFVNDTPGPIFLHSFTSDELQEAYFEFYGIDDGREVELTQTINRPVKLETQIVTAPDVDSGGRVVINKGRIGRYIEWDWNVKKADGTVDRRTIETLYPAAPAVVAVGN